MLPRRLATPLMNKVLAYLVYYSEQEPFEAGLLEGGDEDEDEDVCADLRSDSGRLAGESAD